MKTLERSHQAQSEFILSSRRERGARDSASWARTSATAGAAVWAVLALAARVGWLKIGAIELMFLFAPLVIVPLGMELGRGLVAGDWAAEMGRRLQPAGAVFAVVAMCLPPGQTAAGFASAWIVVCGAMAWSGLMSLGRVVLRSRPGADELQQADPQRIVKIVVAIARLDLAIGGAWLVASRLGLRPMGIQEPIGLLTAVHFHFAAFATATIAAATVRFAGASRTWLRGLVLAVAVTPLAVAAGFVISPAVKMAAACLFSLSVATFAVFLFSVAKGARDRVARVLLRVASGAVFAGMILAAAYVVADFRGSDAVTIPQMVRTHGILNAVGFCLPGLLGWLVEGSQESSMNRVEIGGEFLR